ncbi:MAG TPA: cyclic nucleotide-binding domain-containing protein [Marinobacterium sp.]|nr:cyclic nucleotide-binding domain-containing protein [Marinobacterium sp.]
MNVLARQGSNVHIVAEQLQHGSLFGAMSAEGINFLLDHGQIWQLEKNELLYSSGDVANRFFVVCSGEMRFIKEHGDVEMRTRRIGFGEEIGFVAMISLQPHGGRVEAAEPSIVLEVSCDLYAQLQVHYPQDFGILTLNLARDMARNIQRLNRLLCDNLIQY